MMPLLEEYEEEEEDGGFIAPIMKHTHTNNIHWGEDGRDIVEL